VLAERPGDRDLGADAVGRGRQQRAAPPARLQREQPGEPAEPADDLRPPGPGDRGPHQLDGPLARVDVDAGLRVRDLRAGHR
jgi:hypothetical protein